MPATLLGVVPISVALVGKGSMSVSEMALAVMLAMSMVISMTKIEVFSNSLREMEYTVNEIQGLFDIKKLSEPDEERLPQNYNVELKDVHFTYDEKEGEVLHGIDLSLPEGSLTALVGPSGGGKSTVAKLIARFWEVTGGSIEIGQSYKLKPAETAMSGITECNAVICR